MTEELDLSEKIIEQTGNDPVNHPAHYCTGKYECIEVYCTGKYECIEVMLETQGVEAVMDFCLCNAFKYLFRHKRKNGIQDIEKSIWYLSKYVELAKSNKT